MPSYADLPKLLRDENWPAAEKVLRGAAKKKNAPADVYYNLAKVLEASGKAAQMRPWLERAVTAKPDYATAWFELGRCALAQLDLRLSLRAFDRACALDPKDPDARRNLGRIALRLGIWDKATACFAEDDDTEAQLARYRIASETGEDTQALRKALLVRPDDRPEVLKTLTRTAKGTIPLKLPQLLRT